MGVKTGIKEIGTILPLVPTREMMIFPGMTMHFDVGREKSVKAMKIALDTDYVFLCAQKDCFLENPTKKSDLYRYGTVAKVKQMIKGSDGIYRCLVEGVSKAKLLNVFDSEEIMEAEIKPVANYGREKLADEELTAVERQVVAVFEQFARFLPKMPDEIYNKVMAAKSPIELFEAVAFNIPLSFEDRQGLLEVTSAGEKLVMLLTILVREVDVISLEQQISEQVHSQIDENQRAFYIREQIKALQSELGEDMDDGSSDDNEILEYYNRIAELGDNESLKNKLTDEVRRLSRMPAAAQEAVLIRGYLDTVLAMPWDKRTNDRSDIKKARSILEKDHYGMEKVKERILENIAVRVMSPELKGQIICLAGPPGVGKTSVAKSVARALDRKFVRVSLGGVKDESEIRGHRKTYVGAMPGKIMNGMKLAGSKNPVMLLDEIDKLSNDFRGDPSSALLEVLDGEQNNAFVDHFIEEPFDLSEVLFITTANNLGAIQAPLLDRMEVIELPSYTREEKYHIAREHVIKKQMKKYGLKASQMSITSTGVYKIIDSYTREAGVRNLERTVGSLCRKAAKEIVEDGAEKVTFKADNLNKYLGTEKFYPDYTSNKDSVGCVNGLAWTSVGGVVMPLEVLVLDGKGNLKLTGSLGDVMKESAGIAVSYCRSVADKYGISKDFYEKKDLHIHAPEGAVPKDGPSAGVTMITGIISALSGIKVRSDVAMTGEITLTGRVLAIGGLREKAMGAYRAGMKTVVVPFENKGDMDEVDEVVKNGMEFVFAKKIEDVLKVALVTDDKKKTVSKRGRKSTGGTAAAETTV